jgi:hypothetical protein
MAKADNYPLFMHWYKTMDYILDRTEKMPKHTRYSLNNRIASLSIDVIELITETIYSKSKAAYLRKINLHLEKLRILFRLCKDRHYISLKQYEYISGQLNEAGKMCGGWLKKCEG